MLSYILKIAVVLIFNAQRVRLIVDDHFRDISAQVFDNQSGFLAAFADFNSDKAIDVFVLIAPDAHGGFRQVELNQAQNPRFREEKFSRTTLLKNFVSPITSVMPADLNGDKVQDVLIYSKQDKTITIYWGTGDYSGKDPLNLSHPIEIRNAHVEPLLFDFDGDRIVDILTSVNDSKHRHVFHCEDNVKCHYRDLHSKSTVHPNIVETHSNSFVDLNGDLNADLLISTYKYFEMWIWKAGAPWLEPQQRAYPEGVTAEKVGQSVFVDINSSGKFFHLVQACTPACDTIFIWIPPGQWGSKSGEWKKIFQLPEGPLFWKDQSYQSKVSAMMSLKSADLDQDGYPDLMSIVQLRDGHRSVISLLNRKCSGQLGAVCAAGRSFQQSTNPGDFNKYTNIVNLGFFDIRENGKMDVLVTDGVIEKANWTVRALENIYAEDACFIKVITVSGLCSKDQCRGKGNTIEYGYNQPGPVVKYSIVDSEAKVRSSVSAQLYQTSHGALQLPYVLFGIGLSPNFVETLEVRMPGFARSQNWTQIIPNSQMLVIPQPIGKPWLWQNKLFITPSRKMLDTFLALCGVVLVNVVIILGLHLVEKKADRIEKQQQAHKFNFDAM